MLFLLYADYLSLIKKQSLKVLTCIRPISRKIRLYVQNPYDKTARADVTVDNCPTITNTNPNVANIACAGMHLLIKYNLVDITKIESKS